MNFTETLSAYSPVPLDYSALEKMEKIYKCLDETNRSMNLTAQAREEEAAILHFADSLYPLKYGLIRGNILDVGSGGGFPAMPITAVTDYQMTALDSTSKKLDFIAETAKTAGLSNIKTLCGRAEELALLPEYRESFDTVLSRGVAKLNVLCELCLPFIKVGGMFIAMKGSKGEEEAAEAVNSIKELGGELSEINHYILPVYDRKYCLIAIKKIKPVPQKYPRVYSLIIKKPL